MNNFRKKIRVIKNIGLSVKNYRKRNLVLDNFPTLLWIEPTNRCNLKCIMCPNVKIPQDDLGFMEWGVFKKIIDEIKEFAASAYLLIGGESLLHKDIYKMIRYARDNGIRPLLNTNGTTLHIKENRTKLLESGPAHITFAFDGYNRETYESIRIGAKYDQVLDGIVEFLKEKMDRKLSKPFVAITNLEVGIENYHDKIEAKKKFYKIFEGLPVDEFIAKTPNTWGGTFDDTNRFRHHELDKSQFYPCSHLWSTMSICWDGTVVPCCFDFFKTYVLGNVRDKSIKEIWNDEPMRRLRQSMQDGTYQTVNKLCKSCVILHLDPVLGVPAGMRSAVKDAITNFMGMKAERYLIKITKKLKPSYSLKIDE